MQNRIGAWTTLASRRTLSILGVLAAALVMSCKSKTPSLSTVNTLSNLTVSSGTLTPAFSASVTSYAVSVPKSVASITVTATTTANTATIKVAGVSVASGAASAPQSLMIGGVTSIVVAVYAQNGAVRLYTVAVTRAAT